MIINDLDGYYIVFDTKNWNTELDTLPKNPKDYLRDESPALYNFIECYIPNADIIGLSSQGLEYPKENEESYEATKKEIKAKTREGKRSFVEVGDDIIHDLSLPLYLLIKE